MSFTAQLRNKTNLMTNGTAVFLLVFLRDHVDLLLSGDL